MSFILDALRKSENERQRGSVPDIARVPLAQPAPRAPRWTLAVIVLLSAGVVVLAAAWWQAQRGEGATPFTAAAPPRSAPPAPASSEPAATTPAQVESPPSQAPAGVRDESPTPAPAERRAPAEPEVREPVPEPVRAAAASTTPRSAATDRDAAPPPSIAQLRASGVDVPALDLQLHSYSESGSGRFAFINGTRYVEGEALTSGPRVVRITPNGVVLEQRGREFLLTVE